MPVPINQIPNAPNAIPGVEPLPNTPIPNDARMYSAPTINSPNFDRAQSVLSRTAQLLDAPTPQPVEFIDYASRAWADFGETGARVASNLMDFAVQMQRTKDEGNLAKADNLMAQTYGDFVEWSQDRQPDELLPEWKKRQEAVMKDIGKLSFSQTGAAKLGVLMDNKTVQYGVDVATTARKLQIKNADSELVAARDRSLAMGRYEDAFAYQGKRLGAGFINAGDNEQELLKMEKEQQLNTLQVMRQQDPFGTFDRLNQAVTTGDGTMQELPLLDAFTINQQRERARGEKIQLQRDAITQISDLSLKNPTGINGEQIQALADAAKIPQENADALKNNWKVRYDETPEGQAIFNQKQNDLYFQVRKFQPEIDPSSGELTDNSFNEYMKLDAKIRTHMPAGYIERFTGPLNRSIEQARKQSEGKVGPEQDTSRRSLLDQVELMRKHGVLGDDGGTDKTGKPLNYQKFLQIEKRQAEVSNAVESIFKRNPSISTQEAFQQFQDLFNTQFQDLPAKEFFQEPDNRWFWQRWGLSQALSPMGNNPNVMTAGVSWGSSSLTEGLDTPLPPVGGSGLRQVGTDEAGNPMMENMPRAAPSPQATLAPSGSTVTSYNYKGDEYGDTLSSAGLGAFTRKLTKESMAVSPDVEAALLGAGIQPKDRVTLVMDDGTEITRVWDDRTMQDKQAIKKFGKPLRGRFDFNHPFDGPHPLTGRQVVTFRKA